VGVFDLQLQTSSQLQIKVGRRNTNPSLDIDSLSRQNKVWQRESRLGLVAIRYVGAKQIATR
jgi:hypothetical protein